MDQRMSYQTAPKATRWPDWAIIATGLAVVALILILTFTWRSSSIKAQEFRAASQVSTASVETQPAPLPASRMRPARGHLKSGLMVFLDTPRGYEHWLTVIEPSVGRNKYGKQMMKVRYAPGFTNPSSSDYDTIAVDILRRPDAVTPIYE
jgi:hypothetical protein